MNPTDRYYTADDLRKRAALARKADNPDRAATLEAVARAVETYTAGPESDPLVFTSREGKVVTGAELPEGSLVWGTMYVRDNEPVLLVTSTITESETETDDGEG